MGLEPTADVARHRLLELVLVFAIVMTFAVSRAPTLDQPLLENHGFRQTQTAYSALVFHEDGIDWLRPVLPVFGRDSAVPFEFPLFQAIASVPMAHGVEPDRAVRSTGLAFFILTAVLLWVLLRRVAGRLVGVTGLIVFCFSPFALLWSRTSMIEYLATAAGVGYLLAAVVYSERSTWPVLAAGVLSGSIAFLVKPTTAVAYLIPAAAATFLVRLGSRRQALAPRLALVVVPIVVGGAWTVHADAVKAHDPFAKYLTSSFLRTWNFGTLSQRFDSAVVTQIVDTGLRLIVGPVLLVAFAVLPIWRSSRQPFWLAWLAGALAGPLLFINLYYEHDYYIAAITPLLAGVVALAMRAVTDLVTGYLRNQRPVAIAAVATATLLFWLVVIHAGTRTYSGRASVAVERDNPILELADELRNTSSIDELAIVVGIDYDPSVLYYARRRGTAVPVPGASWPGTIDVALLHRLATTHSLLVVAKASADTSVLRESQWFAPVSAHVYRLAGRRDSLLGRTGLAATTSTAEAAALPDGPSSATTLQCNGESLPIEPGTIVRFEPVTQAGASVAVGNGRAAIPLPTALVVDTSPPEPIAISCGGTAAVVLRITRPAAG